MSALPSGAPVSPGARASARVSWRRALAWLTAAAILVLLFERVQWTALVEALERGPYLLLAAYVLFEILVALPVDAYATRAALAGAGVDRGFRELLLARGASYLLGALSYFAGQGGVGLYLARKGERAGKATGAVLFLMVTNGLVLVWIASAALLLDPPPDRQLPLSILALAALLGTLGYLGILRARPAFLTRYPALEPLFAAGIEGHLRAALARFPHMLLLCVLHWGAFRIWGIPVPFTRGLSLMPVVLLAAAVPVTPSGLGTTQALQVLFFSPFSTETSQAAREASVLAFSLVHQVFSLIGMALVGLACLASLDLEDREGPGIP